MGCAYCHCAFCEKERREAEQIRWAKVAAQALSWIPTERQADFVCWLEKTSEALSTYERRPLAAVRLYYLQKCR